MRVLDVVGELLGVRVAYFHAGAYHFRVGPRGWSIAITPESAGRFRIEACAWSRPLATLYALAADEERVAALVASLARDIDVVLDGV